MIRAALLCIACDVAEILLFAPEWLWRLEVRWGL